MKNFNAVEVIRSWKDYIDEDEQIFVSEEMLGCIYKLPSLPGVKYLTYFPVIYKIFTASISLNRYRRIFRYLRPTSESTNRDFDTVPGSQLISFSLLR